MACGDTRQRHTHTPTHNHLIVKPSSSSSSSSFQTTATSRTPTVHFCDKLFMYHSARPDFGLEEHGTRYF